MINPDFTRWNRQGLPQVRYLNANAVTHLEALRLEFAKCFPEWENLPAAAEPAETVLIWLERLEKQYNMSRQDWAWETSRSFARALHILTEYIDAYANEGYIGTATQWDHIRRLAAMVGYVPKTATSAETRLVLLARGAAQVAEGFQVKHTPLDGTPPVIFETVEDIAVDERLNAVRLNGWNSNPTLFINVFAPMTSSPWFAPAGSVVTKGETALLRDTRNNIAETVTITAFDATSGRFSIATLKPGSTIGNTLRIGDAVLQTYKPRQITPILNGSGVVWLGHGHGFNAGDVAVWPDGHGGSRFARISEVSSHGILIEDVETDDLPSPQSQIAQASVLTRTQFEASESKWRVAKGLEEKDTAYFATARHKGLATTKQIVGNTEEAQITLNGVTSVLVEAVNLKADAGATAVWFADFPSIVEKVDVTAATAGDILLFDGKSEEVIADEWVILEGENTAVAAQIKTVSAGIGILSVKLDRARPTERVRAMSNVLKLSVRPQGCDRDPTPVTSLVLQIGSFTSVFSKGRKLVLEDEDNHVTALIATVAKADVLRGEITISADASALQKFTRGGLIVRGNAVDAIHGETQPLKTLGSGSADLTGQDFALDYTDISTIRDSALPNGQRSAIHISVEGQSYHQVETFRDCASDEPAYVVRVLDSGTLTLRFGDGRQGRRLASGYNNVKALLKRGVGLSGNLGAFSLDKISVPHPAVEDFRQPIASSGGDAREDLSRIAANAPARLKAMDRAISVKDYQRLAAQFGGIWHAAAFEMQNLARFRQSVRVVLVPAGGGALGSLGEDVALHLRNNGLPQTDIVVENYRDIPIRLSAVLRINSQEYDPEHAIVGARSALRDALHLRHRAPGQPLYRSEIVQVLEHIVGVVNVDVFLFPDTVPDAKQIKRGDNGGIWAIYPHDEQVFHAADAAFISITSEEANA
jgi:predicted phage baseplate assembly protein